MDTPPFEQWFIERGDRRGFDMAVLSGEERARLNSRARELKIKGFSRMKRQQLKDAIIDAIFTSQ